MKNTKICFVLVFNWFEKNASNHHCRKNHIEVSAAGLLKYAGGASTHTYARSVRMITNFVRGADDVLARAIGWPAGALVPGRADLRPWPSPGPRAKPSGAACLILGGVSAPARGPGWIPEPRSWARDGTPRWALASAHASLLWPTWPARPGLARGTHLGNTEGRCAGDPKKGTPRWRRGGPNGRPQPPPKDLPGPSGYRTSNRGAQGAGRNPKKPNDGVTE